MNRRLLLGYLGVTLFVLLALEVPLGIQNQRTERRDLEVKIEHDATTLASIGEDAIQAGTPAQLRRVAPEMIAYAAAVGARVVVVDRRGFARIDTSARVPGAENFATASRPEIRAALRGSVAYGTRYSQTLHTRLLYVAVPIASGARPGGGSTGWWPRGCSPPPSASAPPGSTWLASTLSSSCLF